MKYFKPILSILTIGIFAFMAIASGDDSEGAEEVASGEDPSSEECVLGDWLWPSTSDYTAAMKFNEDGSWNSSNTFQPVSFYGTWEIEGDKIIVDVTRSTSSTGIGIGIKRIYYLDGCGALKEGKREDSKIWYKD